MRRVAYILFAFAMFASVAEAAPNDIRLINLIKTDANGKHITRNADFAQLARELGVVMTPSSLQLAETTGQAGFDIGFEYSLADIREKESYWSDTIEGDEPAPVMQTIGMRVRKGFVLPIPLTTEIELGTQWLTSSSLVNFGAMVRLAINEGFPLVPDISVMGGVNRIIGHEQLDMFTVTAGGTISKGFGVSGSANIAPFLSYQSIFLNATTRAIDPTPTNGADLSNNVAFAPALITDSANRMDRVSLGLRVHVALMQFMVGTDFNFVPDQNGNPYLLFQTSTRLGLLF